MDYFIENAFVSGYGLKRQNIIVEDNLITDISPKATIPSPEYKFFDKHNFVSTPLFNSHTHLPMTLLRGYCDNLQLFPWLQKVWALEKHFTRESCSIGAALAFLEMIKSGTGGFFDFYFNEDSILPIAEKTGLRGVLGAGIIENIFLEQGGSSWMLNVAEELSQRLSNHKNSLIKAAVAPHAPHTCSEETLMKSLEIVDHYQSLLTIHVSETREDVINFQKIKNLPPIEWLDNKFNFFTNRPVVAVHCVWIQQREIEILARNHAGMVYCPVSAQKLAYGGLPPVPEMYKAGITVCLGTDGAASNNTLDMVRELRSAMNFISNNRWNPGLISTSQIIDFATTSFPQHFLGLSNYGLHINSPADLTIFNFNTPHTCPIHDPASTLVFSANVCDANSVIINGKPLMIDRKVLTFNEEQVIDAAEKELEKIKDRAISSGDLNNEDSKNLN